MPRPLSRFARRFKVLRRWLRKRNWLDNLTRLREWLTTERVPRPRWWPILAFEELEGRWNPAPIQIFYIPMPEADVRVAMTQINNSGSSPTGTDMSTFINIAATENGTIINYDHWEDGYETNFNTPVQSTTEIWGDGIATNGAWPGAPAGTDPAITAGQVIRIRNVVAASPRLPATILYDGGDKVGANRTVTISRAQFPVAPGSVIGSAVEVRDTRFFDTTYVSPVGTNTPGATAMYSYTAFFVMAAQNNTVVQIDRDNNGSFEQTVTLNQGQTVVSATNVLQGGRVVASKPVQVQLLTGHIGGEWASRSYTLFPTSQLANNYFTPVARVTSGASVVLYAHNPNATTITVNYEQTAGATGTLGAILPGATASFTVPLGVLSGTRLFTAGLEPFATVGANDAGLTTYDWGFSLQPVSSLSQLALVALGVGNSNNPPNAPGVANSSPVWVTPLAPTTVFVDYDGNPATGANVDSFGNHYDISYNLARLQSQQLRDNSDNDNSGMRIYTTDGTLISTAWGEDATTAPGSAPGFDVGSTVPAVPVPEFYKFAEFAPGGDANSDGYINAGDTIRYTLRIRHIGTTPINNALITDALPPEVQYVDNTTFIDQGGGPLAIADSGASNFPLDEAGYTIVNLTPGGTTFITFDVTIRTGLAAGTTETTNLGLLTFDIFRLPAVNTIQLRGAIGDRIWQDLDADGAQDAGEPGIPNVGVTLTWFGPNGVLGGGDDRTFTATTDSTGTYHLVDLPSGKFSLAVNTTTLPDTFAGTFDLDGTGTANVTDITLGTAEARNDADFGYRGTSSIGDQVWFDGNADGVKQTGEPGLAGVTVTLLFGGDDGNLATTADNITYTTTTDAAGLYGFTNLFGGDFNGTNPNYRATVTPPALFPAFTFDATAPADGVSSLQLAAGASRLDQDFGFAGTGSVAGTVWHDANANALLNAGEPGIATVGVTVTWLGFDGTAGGGDDVAFTTTTNATGGYSVGNLPAGNYSVAIGTASLPDNFVQTFDIDGLASANTAARTLIAGEAAAGVDFGYRGTSSIGDRVWYDVDGDGVQDAGEPGIPGATVALLFGGDDGDLTTTADNLAYSTTTDASGLYAFPNLFGGDLNGANPNHRVTVTPPAIYTVATFDAAAPADGVSTLQLANGSTRTDQDFGFRGTSSIGDFVWQDSNGNGVQDAGEPGIVGITVQLQDPLGTILATTTTGVGGAYSFPGLVAGTYQLQFGTTVGATTYSRTVADRGSDAADSDAAVATGLTPQIVLPGATSNITVDAGLYIPVTLGDRVWFDTNANGVQDSGEPGEPGASIVVTWFGPDGVSGGGDDQAFNATTGADGLWSVANLPPGKYSVTVSGLIGGLSPTFDADGTATANTAVATTTSGVNRSDIDFGYTGTGSLAGTLWHDLNANGVQNAGEPGIPVAGVTVTWLGFDNAVGGGDDVVYSATTNATGGYSVSGLPSGKYVVATATAALPDNFVPTFDIDGVATANAAVRVLAGGETATGANFGYRGTATLGDRVWYDVDGDGVQDNVLGDGFEPGIAGATVTLLFGGDDGDLTTSADNLSYSAVTDANGNYQFANLFGGDFNGANPNYRVTAAAPAAFTVPTFDADGTATANQSSLQLADGASNLLQDFGYRGAATQGIGNFVWEDWNGNGRQDVGEPGIGDATVELWAAGVDGAFNTGDDVQLDVTITTAGTGLYSFPNLVVGSYQIRFTAPAGYVFTAQNAAVANSSTDSNAVVSGVNAGRTASIAVSAAAFDNNVDAGLYRLVTLSDRVYLDQNGDGVQQGTEPGIVGVTVNATWLGLDGAAGGGDDVLFSTTTVANGSWSIANLPPGSYSVQVVPPAAGGFTLTDSIDDGVLNATNPVTISTNSGVNRPDVDFGFRGTGAIGDRVYHDLNGDGVQQGTEPGLFGVGVSLTWAGLDGSFGTADDAAYTATTGANGNYGFANLPAGTFRVDVNTGTLPGGALSTDAVDDGLLNPGNSATVTLATGATRSDADFGYRGTGVIGDLVWYDVNGNGTREVGAVTEPGIAGATITLLFAGRDGDLATAADNITYTTTTNASGGFQFANLFGGDFDGLSPNYRASVVAPGGFTAQTFDATAPITDGTSFLRLSAAETNLAQDFGYRGAAALGNFVWLDNNGNAIQDAGEPGIDGVTVQLLDSGGAVIAQTTTAGGGLYSFPGLVAGSYSLRFGNSNGVITFVRAPANIGADDAVDSDANTATGLTGTYTLLSGQMDNTASAGLHQLASVGDRVWFDADADGVQDTGEAGTNGVTVLLDYAGLDGAFATADDQLAVANQVTSADGNYTFSSLAPGTYRTRVDTSTLPAGLATPTFDLDGIGSANQATFTLVSAQTRTDADFGYRGTGVIGDRIWIDSNGDGLQGPTALEPGLPGVGLILTWAGRDGTFGNADDVAFATTTDASGLYSFVNLPAGNFRADVQTGTLPTNVTQTFDLTPPLNHSATRTLAAGGTASDVDFGYAGAGSIGDRVWYDVDGSGTQNNAEPGIPGATVTLTWAGPDGSLATAADNVTFSTTTDANGDYSFPGLPVSGASDPYRATVTLPVVFTDPTFDSDGMATPNQSTLALGANESNAEQDFGARGPATQGIGSFVWEDLNGNGRQDAGEPGVDGIAVELYDATGTNLLATATTVGGGAYSFPNLIPGSYQVRFGAGGFARTVAHSAVANAATDSDADVVTGFTGPVIVAAGAFNNDVDAGLYSPVSFGDLVWFDLDADGVQDAGEPGIPGVAIAVTWFGPDATPGGGDDQVFSATTDASGIWTIANLPPGTYSVQATPPAASGFTALVDSLDDGVLNAANPVTITTTSGVNRPDADFGFRGTGSLGDFVWHDVDADGVQDAGEPGIAGVNVRVVWFGSDDILGNGDDVTFNAASGTNGLWSLANLPAGSFQVNVLAASLPAGAVPTFDFDGIATANSAVRVLAPAEAATDQDFGYRGNSSIGDRVWYDVDGDGVQDAVLGDGFESGIPGTAITLLFAGQDGDLSTAADNLTYTTTTGADGLYSFPSLFAGSYRITVTAPAGYPVPSFDADGTGTPSQSTLALADGELNTDQDFGYRGPATQSFGNFVWEDSNGNGRQDSGEPGLANVTVELWSVSTDTQLDVTSTDVNGLYTFPNLAASAVFGPYQIRVTAPSGYVFATQNSAAATSATDSDVDALGHTGPLILSTNEDSIDAGMSVPVSLAQSVWFDTDADGTQDAGEPGIPNATITVTWFGPNGNQTFATTTAADGTWILDNLPPGTFSVAVTNLPPDLVPTYDLDGIATPGVTLVSTTSGVDRDDVDFGWRGIGSVGDRVFLDVNGNGLFDAGEGLDGATVTLSGDLNGDGVPETLTTATAADGAYQFTNLRTSPAGVPYTISVNGSTLPAPTVNSADPDGGNDGSSSFMLLTADPSNQLQDFGYQGPNSIGDTIFLDVNGNGLPDAGEGITGVDVTLSADIDGDGGTESFATTTDVAGRYLFANLPTGTADGAVIVYTVTVDAADLPAGVMNTTDPDTAGTGDGTSSLVVSPGNPVNLDQDFGYRGPGSVGDRVFLDLDGDGLFQTGEGLAGITLTLAADVNGDGLVETFTTATDADGLYQFTGLPVFEADGSTPVPYTLTVAAATLPAGVANATDPDGGNDNTWNGTLEANQNRTDLDFGYRGTGSFGDRVWIDSNGDGVQGPAALEPGLPGASYSLTWAGPDGSFGNADDATTATTGDANGNYGFANLPPGVYRVDVGGVPANMMPSFDLDGTGTANSATFSLADGEARTDADFGYSGNSTIGDRVWFDRNRDGVQDPFEPGVPGVVVQLTWSGPDGDLATAADNVLFTTTTNSAGQYSFPGLPVIGASQPHRVTILSVPLMLAPTYDLDSGIASPDGTVLLNLAPGVTRNDLDFGYAGGGSLLGKVFRDDNNDGFQAPAEPGIGGITITLTGVDPFGNPIVEPITGQPYTAVSAADGSYFFIGLVPGVYTLTETQSAAYADGIDTAGTLGGNPGNDATAGINVGPNQSGTGYNFGERGSTVSGSVYRDDNRDGTRQPGEPGIPGVAIELRDPTGTTLIATMTTDANGNYSFPNLPAGDYRIVEIQPADYGNSPVGPATIRDVTLPVGGLTGQNFSEVQGRIGGTVYVDLNGNGVRDAGEPGLGGVSIQLTIPGGAFTLTQTTDANGDFLFDNLVPADYRLIESQPAGFNQGTNAAGTVNGSENGVLGPNPDWISSITLGAGDVGTGYLFGELNPPTGFISGTVYLDVDANGQPGGPGEFGIAGVAIELLDSAGAVIDATTTDANGGYIFSAVPQGDYTVRETQPAGYGTSTPNILSVTVPAVGGATGQSFGETLAGISGSVYFDQNRDGTRQAGEPGIPGVTVMLSGADAAGNPVNRTTVTDASGNYQFTNLPAGTYTVTESQPAGWTDGTESAGSAGGLLAPPDSITSIPLGAGASASGNDFAEVGVPMSGIVFRDDDQDGALDAGEPGVPGVVIQLVDAGGAVIDTAVTDASGIYTFPNVPPGTYTLVEVQPVGYGSSPTGPFAPDSRPITVADAPIANQNFGDTLSSLAGSVFIDTDTSGSRDPGEAGVGGVPIRLDSAGLDGTFGTLDDVTGHRATTTNANGDYSFTLLPTGLYRIVETTQPSPFLDGSEAAGAAGGNTSVNDQITNIPLAAGTNVTGYTFAELSTGAFIAGTVYLDTNGNGVQDSGEPGVPGVLITATSGVSPPASTVTDANGNYVFTGIVSGATYTISEAQPPGYASGPENAANSVDVLVPANGASGLNFGETGAVASGTVYFDRDASGSFTSGDVPLAGVVVELQDGGGNTIATQVTAADGSYSFTNLASGTYRVVETQPANYNQGTNTPGAGAAIGGTDRLDLTLSAGAVSSGNNFGELGAAITGTVWLDSDQDGTRDPGEATGIGGVTITVLDTNGTVVGSTTSNPDGSYIIGNLPPGSYTLVQTQPAAYGSTTPNTIPVTLTPAGSTGADFGERLSTLRGNVFADTNGTGTRDAGESGLGGVTVTLSGMDVNGNAFTQAAVTDANGDYVFTNIPAGTYTITETQPSAFSDGTDAVGSAGGALAPTDSIINVPVGAGTDPVAYTFAEVTSSLSGYVYRDFDLNSSRTIGGANPDTGIANITITLTGTDNDGRPVSLTTLTAADGSYTFVGLGAGSYTITEAQPPLPTTLFDGFYDGADSPGSLGGSNLVKNQLAVALGAGLDGVAYNFGELPPADPFGYAYIDLNQNGAMDPGEPGLANVAITISGTAFAGTAFARPLVPSDIPGGSLTLFTDVTGRFEYSPIPPGLYTLTETQPLGYADGLEQDGDPNGPPATIGNDSISNIVLAPFPIRGPFNFGEVRLVNPPGPLPPIDFFPPTDPSKRMFLGSTPVANAPLLPTSPAFANFNPGVRPAAFAAVAEDAGGLVRVFDFAAGVERFRFQPFGDFAGGVRTATADVTGDGIPDIIAVPGPGGGPIVKVFDGNTGAQVRSFLAFDDSFRGGLRVAAADVNGDFAADIIVTPDAGGGPIVRAFDGATGAVLANFFALDDSFRGGLRIAAADVNNDGVGDLLVTAGIGGGPHVAVYDGAALLTTQAKIGGDFFAFDASLRSGFWISGGDVDGDGFDDIVLGAGEGGAPRVVAYSGQVFASGGGAVPVASFFAGDSAARNGARVLATDLDGDGRSEILSAGGPVALPVTFIYDPLTGVLRDQFYSFPVTSQGGVNLG